MTRPTPIPIPPKATHTAPKTTNPVKMIRATTRRLNHGETIRRRSGFCRVETLSTPLVYLMMAMRRLSLITGSVGVIECGQMVVTRPSEDQMSKRCPTDASAGRVGDERDGLVDRLGQRIVMASAVRTLARGARSLAAEEFQHRAASQVRLFAS